MYKYKCSVCGNKSGLSINQFYNNGELIDSENYCNFCGKNTIWEEDSEQTQKCESSTYTTVEFCENYQAIYRCNIDWSVALKIIRTGGMDNCPRHKAIFSLNGKTVEFEDYLPKKEVKARAIALWQKKYKL